MLYNSKSKIQGIGLYTDKLIKRGSYITKLTGKIVISKDHESIDSNALQIGPDTFMMTSGGLDDYTNHSCSPNSEVIVEQYSVFLKALHDIKQKEEITFDYSTTIKNDTWQMKCNCGSKDCKKVIKEILNATEN